MNMNSGSIAPDNAGKPRDAQPRKSPATALPPGLTLATGPHKPAKDARDPDPYNSSGSFDRTKNWARVGKR